MNTKVKVLYDKKTEQYGSIINSELYYSRMPVCFALTATLELISNQLLRTSDKKTLLENYELIEITISKETSIDEKILELRELTSNFLIIEHYTHTNTDMYKIISDFTHYKELKHVLCPVSEGIDKALDLAIEQITKDREEFFE